MAVPSKSVPQKDSPQPATLAPERAERLAAALRENLKRRKAQARAQGERASDQGKPAGPVDGGRSRS